MAKKKTPNKNKSDKIKEDKHHIRSCLKSIYRWINTHRDIYPVIAFAMIPVLVFWKGRNVTQLTFSLMTRAFFVYAIIGIIIYGLLYYPLGKSKYKASVLSILILPVILTYSEVYKYYDSVNSAIFGPKSIFANNISFLLIAFILLTTLGIIIKRKMKFSKTFRNYLALFATASLIFNTYPIVKSWLNTRSLANIPFGEPIGEPKNKIDQPPPDIYYLIFDRYANEKVLKREYGFDNTPFLDSLRKNNFYIASDSSANYPFTSYSLSSSLNLGYLPEEYNDKSKNKDYNNYLQSSIEDNHAVHFLKSNNYKFINIGPWWNPTKYNKFADQNIPNPEGFYFFNKKIDLKNHENLLFQKTLFFPLSKNPTKLGNKILYGRTYPADDIPVRAGHRQTFLHQFETLKKIGETKSQTPKYVFSHVLLPHDPYVVDKNCNHTQNSKIDEYIRYINQLQCANTLIKDMVEHIIKNSPSDPIIIVQSDEGPYPKVFRKNYKIEWAKVPARVLQQKEGIINAYHFPDRNYSQLYQDISPVNTFRVIFNQYLGTDLPLLEDRHYFPEKGNVRRGIIDVTEKVDKPIDDKKD